MGSGIGARPIVASGFPTKPDALTTAWLTEKLGYPVTDFEVELLGEGGGLLGLVTRLHLKSEGGPASLIAKFPTEAADNRAVATTYDMYGREYRFYTQVAPEVPLRAPACYHAEFNLENSDFIFLIEDLQGYRIGDQVEGCSLQEAHQIVESIASLHRSTWQPDHIKDIRQHDMPYQREGMKGGFAVGWPVCKSDFADCLTDEAIAVGDNTPDYVDSLLDEIHQGPMVIAHGDVRLDNIFFGSDHVALVDFQAVCKAAPEHDLAYFITQSVSDEIRGAEDWVAVYHKHLTRDGIEYDLELSRERYRKLAMYFFCYAVIIAGTLDTANERGRKLAELILGNCVRSLTELNAFELIR